MGPPDSCALHGTGPDLKKKEIQCFPFFSSSPRAPSRLQGHISKTFGNTVELSDAVLELSWVVFVSSWLPRSSPVQPSYTFSARAPRESQKRGPPQAFRALCPKMAPRFSQRLSRRPPDASRDSREGPRRHQEPPKRPRTTHKTPPKGPERLPNRPRPVSRRLLTRSPGLAI